LISLPFGGQKQPSGPSSEEMQACYRLLGVSEDATYDDVEAAFDLLYNVKYKGQTKLQIKLKVAKDKIYEETLRRRISGQLKAPVVTSPFDREIKKEFTLPSWLDGIAELPTRDYFFRNAGVFAAIGLVPLFFRSFAGNSITIALGVAMYKLYNRGAPESSGMEAEMRPPKAKPLILTAGICFLSAALGGLFGASVAAKVLPLPAEVAISLTTSLFLAVASALGKVQD